MSDNNMDDSISFKDFGQEEPLTEKNIKEPWHPEKAGIGLAHKVLIAIFCVLILSILTNWLSHINILDEFVSKELFEICRTGLLPIVTLILGYYFSKND